MKLNKKIALVGVGNMGTSILEGLIESKISKASQIRVYDKIKSKEQAFRKKWKLKRSKDIASLVQESDILILAIKPQDLESVAGSLKPHLKKSHVVVSILAGIPLAQLRSKLGVYAKIVRAMPNLGAKVGQSMTALTSASSTALREADKIFKGCGSTVSLGERFFDLVTAISGSGPAYFFYMMEIMQSAGVQAGLKNKEARVLATQTALGAAQLAMSSSFSPQELRRMVTSKKGTTDAALREMKKNKFETALRKGISAAVRRGRELSKN